MQIRRRPTRYALLTLVLMVTVTPRLLLPQSNDQSQDQSDDRDWIYPLDQGPDSEPDWVRPDDGTAPVESLDTVTRAVVAAQAHSFEFDAKMDAIRYLAEQLEAGAVAPRDPAAVEILSFLALERYQHEIRRDGRLINDYPIVRAEAIRLLGAVGGDSARLTIRRVLTVEQDPYVLGVAVRAAAVSSDVPDQELFQRLTYLVGQMNARQTPDNSLAQAIVSSVLEMQQRLGRIDDPDLFRAIISIAQGSYNYGIREQALDLIDLLRTQDRPQ